MIRRVCQRGTSSGSVNMQPGQGKGHSFMNASTVFRRRAEQAAEQFQGSLLKKPKREDEHNQNMIIIYLKNVTQNQCFVCLYVYCGVSPWVNL